MSTLVIKSDKKTAKLLSELAKSLGSNVIKASDEQFEDFMLGTMMNQVKTEETVSRDRIIAFLKK